MNAPIIQRICCGLLHRQVRPSVPVFIVDAGQHDIGLELRKKIYDVNKELAYWGIPVEKLHLWKLSPPVDTEDERCANELGNIFTFLHNKNTEPYAVEKVSLSDKIVDVFDASERQGAIIQVLAQVDLDDIFGIQSIPSRLELDIHLLSSPMKQNLINLL